MSNDLMTCNSDLGLSESNTVSCILKYIYDIPAFDIFRIEHKIEKLRTEKHKLKYKY